MRRPASLFAGAAVVRHKAGARESCPLPLFQTRAIRCFLTAAPTRSAQDSLLKLLTGMCDDVCPLNWRDVTEKDRVTPDPYHGPAPGWSTLSGGRKPYVQMDPAAFVPKLKRAAECVPMVRSVRVFVVDAQGAKRSVTVEELAAMDIKVQPVPNLYKKAAASSSGAGSSGAGSSGASEVAHVLQRQSALEEQLKAMKALMEKMAATVDASAAAAAAAAATADPSAAASKRARRE